MEKNIGTIEASTEKFEMKEVDLGAVEELETAIAPGGLGIFCGCDGGNSVSGAAKHRYWTCG